MIIEGKNAILETFRSGKTINKLFIDRNLRDKDSNDIIYLAKNQKVKIDFVDRKILDGKSKTKNHQGFVCEITEFVYCEVDDILKKAEEKGEDKFILILDGVEDPHNLGAIIRTAECAGVHGIIIPKNRACAVNDTVYKTSAGAIENILIARVTNINREIEYLKERNVWVFACEVGGKDAYKTNLTGDIAIVLGSEGNGVSKLTLEKCDDKFSFPLNGRINSLNVSVAGGIAVYEAVRQRKN